MAKPNILIMAYSKHWLGIVFLIYSLNGLCQSTAQNQLSFDFGVNSAYSAHDIFDNSAALAGFDKPNSLNWGVNIGLSITVKSVLVKLQGRQTGFRMPQNTSETNSFNYQSNKLDFLLGYRFGSNKRLRWSPLLGVSTLVQSYEGQVEESMSSQNLNQFINSSNEREFVKKGSQLTAGFLVNWFPSSDPSLETSSFTSGLIVEPSFSVQVISGITPFESQWSTVSGKDLNVSEFSEGVPISVLLGFSLHIAPTLFNERE